MLFCPCRSDYRAGRKDDNNKEPVPLGEIMGGVIKSLKGPRRITEEEMLKAWRQAAGRAAARHSRPTSIKKGTLFVAVDRSSWLYELTTRKKVIVGRLEAELKNKKVRDIRFRIREIEPTDKVKGRERKSGKT